MVQATSDWANIIISTAPIFTDCGVGARVSVSRGRYRISERGGGGVWVTVTY